MDYYGIYRVHYELFTVEFVGIIYNYKATNYTISKLHEFEFHSNPCTDVSYKLVD